MVAISPVLGCDLGGASGGARSGGCGFVEMGIGLCFSGKLGCGSKLMVVCDLAGAGVRSLFLAVSLSLFCFPRAELI